MQIYNFIFISQAIFSKIVKILLEISVPRTLHFAPILSTAEYLRYRLVNKRRPFCSVSGTGSQQGREVGSRHRAEKIIIVNSWQSGAKKTNLIGCRSVARTGHRQDRGQWQNGRGIPACAVSNGLGGALPRPESGLYGSKRQRRGNAFPRT